MTPGSRVRDHLVFAALVASLSCAHLTPPPGPADQASIDDPSMIAFWRMDEPLTEDTIHDAGPHALHGTAGPGVHTDQGKMGSCRVFNGMHDCFIYVPYTTALDSMGTIVVEAQVMASLDEPNPIQTIAARWGPKEEFQSWILFLVGSSDPPAAAQLGIESSNLRGKLLFALRSDRAPVPQVFAADGFEPWRVRAWNHVAVSVDGDRISFYINGRLDSSFPCLGRIRPSRAPLTIGNILAASYDMGTEVWYRGLEGTGFSGMIDEFRISPIERARSWSSPGAGDR